MTTKLGLISDPHAKHAPVDEALAIFRQHQVDSIICAGDVAGYFDETGPVIALLTGNNCQTVMGNHDESFLETHAAESDTPEYTFLHALPSKLEYQFEGKRIYVVHAHPPESLHGGIKLLDVNGELIPQQKQYWQQQLQNFDYDVLVVGHTHQVFAEMLGHVLAINPGSTQFNHTCMILSLPEMRVQLFSLQGKEPLKSWNWGKFIHDQ
ncbi:MAG: metallophosphoesterase family protein [Gammaproteobacteria bacterium]|jgi:protein phosphatase